MNVYQNCLNNSQLVFEHFIPGYHYKVRKKNKDTGLFEVFDRWSPVSKRESQHRAYKDKQTGQLRTMNHPDPYVKNWQKHCAREVAKAVLQFYDRSKFPIDGYLIGTILTFRPAPKNLKFPPGVDFFPSNVSPDCDNYAKPIFDSLDRTGKFLEWDTKGFQLQFDKIVENDGRFIFECVGTFYVKDIKHIGAKIEIYKYNIDSIINEPERWQMSSVLSASKDKSDPPKVAQG